MYVSTRTFRAARKRAGSPTRTDHPRLGPLGERGHSGERVSDDEHAGALETSQSLLQGQCPRSVKRAWGLKRSQGVGGEPEDVRDSLFPVPTHTITGHTDYGGIPEGC